MPARIKLTIQGTLPEDPHGHARALQALVYKWISVADSEIASLIHDNSEGIKPIAIAPITALDRESAQIEISTLDDSLVGKLCEGILKDSKTIYLKIGQHLNTYTIGHDIQISHFSWQELIDKAKPATAWRIELLSPTSSRKGGRKNPLPQPEVYFTSWYHKWQRFAPKEAQLGDKDSLIDFVKTRIEVTGQRGETISHRIHQNDSTWPTFIGTVEYRTNKPHQRDAEHLKQLDALTLLSSFSGTGAQTMCGMGQTRPTRLEVLEA